MIDINFLRAEPEKVRDLLKIKNYDLKIDLFTASKVIYGFLWNRLDYLV